MPYALQIVVLTEAFRVRPRPDAQLRELLSAWFWMTTYGELFAGMSGDRVQLALTDMHEMLKTKKAVWTWKRPFEERPISKSFDFRAARAKAFAFRLADIQNQVDSSRTGSDILADAGRKSVIQIVPWGRLASAKSSYSSPGNRFLVLPAEAGKLRDAIVGGDVSNELRERHLISDDAFKSLTEGNFARFIQIRLSNIVDLESRFMRPLVERFSFERRV